MAQPLHGTYVGSGKVLVRTTFGAKLLVPGDDLTLMPDLVCDGIYDAPFAAYLRRSLSAGQVAYDVGANVGLFTLLMAWQVGPTGHVTAWEPEPRNLTFLRENVALNYADRWVDVRDAGVGETHDQVALHRVSRFQGNHSIVPFEGAEVGLAVAVEESDTVPIRLEPLDDHVGRHPEVALVKVDVEGAEAQVLRGARRLLASGAVTRLSLEVNRPRAGAEWEPLVDELRALHAAGWTFATIREDGTTDDLALDRLVAEGRFSQVLVERLF